MSRISAGAMLTLAFFLFACARQGEPQKPSRDPHQAAEQALVILRTMVTSTNYRDMGFESPDEVKTAQLGAPVKIYVVELNKLREYSAGSNFESMLTESKDTLYPVTVGSNVRSSIRISNEENGWKATGFGGANLIKAFAKQRGTESDVQVQVPAFNLFFVGERRDNRLILVPIVDDPRFNLKAGSGVPAEEMFRMLSAAAKEHNQLPT